MESMWFYVLCFYIFIYGRCSVRSCSCLALRGVLPTLQKKHIILYRKKFDLKNDRKIPGVRRFQASETKEQMQQHLLFVVLIFTNVEQLVKGYLQIRKHNQM